MGRIVDVRHALSGLKAGQDIVCILKYWTMLPNNGHFA